MDIAILKTLRTAYVASLCIFYLEVFKTDSFDSLVMDCESKCKAELLSRICDILNEKGNDYNALVDFLENEAAGDSTVLGIESRSSVTQRQFASSIMVEIELLNKPITINWKSNLPEF